MKSGVDGNAMTTPTGLNCSNRPGGNDFIVAKSPTLEQSVARRALMCVALMKSGGRRKCDYNPEGVELQ